MTRKSRVPIPARPTDREHSEGEEQGGSAQVVGAPGSSHEVWSHGGGLGTAPLHADSSPAPALANRRGAGGALPPGGG
eukprot:8256262-Alexandrium_andersonii.AAC.1